MKKLLNDPRNVVPEMLEGLAWLDDRLQLLDGADVVLRADAGALRAKGRVALISGGGSGHEPAHAGYVGEGLLTAAVAGGVFASPSTDAVLAAIEAVAGPAGALLIVKNYTGDRLNFGLAADIARSRGTPVAMAIVDDDVALGAGGGAGRRGIAGTVLIHKIAGAAAAAGLSLDAVKAEVEAAIAATGTMGVAFSGCTLPGAESSGFDLGADEIELGLGIHGEAGVERAAMAQADMIVETLVARILADRGIGPGDEVALLVNGLGATPAMELAVAARAALAALGRRSITVRRSWCGSYLTALDMQGFSLSVMKLDAQRLARLDAPASASAWMAGARPALKPARRAVAAAANSVAGAGAHPDLPEWRRVARALTDAVRREEPRLTALDRQVGDGDIGLSLRRGADALDAALEAGGPPGLAALLVLASETFRRNIGGTSGPLYAVAALRAAQALPTTPTQGDWAQALLDAAGGVSELGGAQRGDRTMLDALIPAAEAFARATTAGSTLAAALGEAAQAARTGADATAAMAPRKGRSSYLGARVIGHPDPGAEAIVAWFEALQAALSSRAA